MEHTIQVPAVWESIDKLMDFTDAVERDLSLDDSQSFLTRLVIEEIATNIMKYGYGGPPGRIEVHCVRDAKQLRLTIRDDGSPFDLSSWPKALPDSPGREAGGLGLFLVRDLSDSLIYQRNVAGWNELVVTKHGLS